MAWGGDTDLTRGLAALRSAVLEALLPPRPALAGMLLSEIATGPGPGSDPAPDQVRHSGSGGYGDADLATSSEDSEADQTRLIAFVELAREGDKEAFGLLFDHYHGSVHRFLYYRT
ncbi:MAG: sigma-70 family RNA polymerase sigma factor, partial [Nocardioides sp.]